MEALNQQLAAEGAPVMRMRLGVHSGMVLAGSIGSSERLEYAISGDTVKFASRIESLEKDRHDGLHGQRWGDLQVTGRLEPLETWELRNRAGRSGPRARSMRGLRRSRDRSGGGSAAPCDRRSPDDQRSPAINAGVLELEIVLAVGLSERPAVGVAGREVGKI